MSTDDEIRAQYDRLQRLSGMDIFERRGGRDEPGGFKFVIPSTAISSDNVAITRDTDAHSWVLTYEDAGRTWTGRHDNLTLAYLDLIAERLGCADEWRKVPPTGMSASGNAQPLPSGNNGEA